MISMDFSGKRVLVVGGSSGIGNAAAQMFRRAGASVHVTGTRSSPADYAGSGSDLDGLTFHQLDTGNRSAIERFEPQMLQLDVLVNAAAMVKYQRAEFEIAVFEQVLSANLTGLMQLAMKFLPQLRATNGNIVNVGSVASFRAVVGTPAYSASKGGLLTLTKTLAQAFASDGVRVNLVAPGFFRTKMTEVTWANERRFEQTTARVPLGRFGEPDEAAAVILFLASSLASYMTGEMVVVDGGFSI